MAHCTQHHDLLPRACTDNSPRSFRLKKSTAASGLIIPLVIFTLLFHEYCRRRFLPIFNNFSTQALVEMDREDEMSEKMEEIHKLLQSAYRQPAPIDEGDEVGDGRSTVDKAEKFARRSLIARKSARILARIELNEPSHELNCWLGFKFEPISIRRFFELLVRIQCVAACGNQNHERMAILLLCLSESTVRSKVNA